MARSAVNGTAPPVDASSVDVTDTTIKAALAEKVPPAVDGLLPLVRAIARAVSHGLPPVVELDDLVHDGVVGLLESTRRFDPTRGVDFRTYASYRIRGAILDGLRARDPLPRSVRRALRAADQAAAPPHTPHIAASSPPAIARSARVPVVTQLLSLEEAGPVPEDGAEPVEQVLAAELREDLHRAVAALPSRDREVLYLRFTRRWRLREVASHYGISITRVAELQERAIRRLRVALDVPHPAGLSPNGRPRRSRSR